MTTYPLYYTLHKDNSSVKNINRKKMTAALLSSIPQLNEKEKEAILLLIIEHFRYNGGVIDFSAQNIEMPYDGVNSTNSVHWDVDKLPDNLLIILTKFLDIRQKNM
jgi:hypothetical protein